MRRQYNDLWSEDESREQESQDPIPESQIFPQLPLRGTIILAIMIAIGALGSVGEVEPDDRQRVGERRQDPGQELNWRELGKIRSQLFWWYLLEKAAGYLLHSNKQVPGRFDPQEVQVAEGHQANGDDGEDGDDGENEERLKRLAQGRSPWSIGECIGIQEIYERGRSHCNGGTNL